MPNIPESFISANKNKNTHITDGFFSFSLCFSSSLRPFVSAGECKAFVLLSLFGLIFFFPFADSISIVFHKKCEYSFTWFSMFLYGECSALNVEKFIPLISKAVEKRLWPVCVLVHSAPLLSHFSPLFQ